MLFLNLGALRPGSRLVHVLASTLAAGFGTPVARAPLHNQANVLLVAMRGGFPPPPPRDSALLIEVSFARHRSGDFVLAYDLCPVESLTARDLQLR